MTYEDYEKITDLVLSAANVKDPIRALLKYLAASWPELDAQWHTKHDALDCHPE